MSLSEPAVFGRLLNRMNEYNKPTTVLIADFRKFTKFKK